MGVSELEPAEFPVALKKAVGQHKQYALVAANDVVEVRDEWHRDGLRGFVGCSKDQVTFARLLVFGSRVLLNCYSYGSDLMAFMAHVEHALAAHRDPMLAALRADKNRTAHAQVFFPLGLSKSTFQKLCPKIGLQLPPAGPLLDQDRFYLTKVTFKLLE